MHYTRVIFFGVISILISCVGYAQILPDGSNLPIVIIEMDGGFPIPDAPRAKGNMKIIYKGPGVRNFYTDKDNAASLNYNGRIEIEIRGSSSQALPKKQYGFTTLQSDNINTNSVSLLGMPKENDWVLNGLAFDPSLMRDYISYNLSRQIGQYAPRTQYCEVIINGDYQGLYILQEKIKVDDNRVDIVKIDINDNALPDLSGGYITKADKVTFEDPSAWTMSTYLGSLTDFIHEVPKPGLVTSAQHSYIRSVFTSLSAKAIYTSKETGFASVIDVPSFIDFMLINELAANVDAYQFSTYFHKDRNGKLRAGPLWDLNLTYGNDLTFWGLDRSWTNTWQFDNGDNVGPKFWKDLFNNSVYRCYLSKRWTELTATGKPLSLANIYTLIDETVSYISEAAAREQSRWGTVGDHASHISNMKTWLSQRVDWMTPQLSSFATCANVITPPLVISKIHYYPQGTTGFPESSDHEFIELVNTGNQMVDLTGIYFGGTGFVYQFEPGTTLEPGAIIQLANNQNAFLNDHGFLPYGEFTRSLSNNGQKLSLLDAYGNVIDEVNYSNLPPWPNASYNGSYIKLISNDLDNGLAQNWQASSLPITTTIVGLEPSNGLEIFPNPTTGQIFIQTSAPVNTVTVLSSRGETLKTYTNYNDLNLTDLSAGLYWIKLSTENKVVIKKLIKH